MFSKSGKQKALESNKEFLMTGKQKGHLQQKRSLKCYLF